MYTVTSEALAPIMDTLTSNAAVIVPFGLTVMGVMIGIGFIPKLVKKLTKG